MQKTILLVDDESDIRFTVKEILQKNGYNVYLAVNGDDCLEKIGIVKPDLVIMDIMMPGTPVRDIVSKLGKTKVVYFSVVRIGEAEREELLKTKNIVDFIQKPFEINDFLSRIKKAAGG